MIAVAILLAASLGWAVAVRFFWKAGAWLPYFIVGAAGCAILLVFGLRPAIKTAMLQRLADPVGEPA